MEKKLTSLVIGVIAIIGLMAFFGFQKPNFITGGADRNSTYQSKNLLSVTGSSTTGTLLKTGSATLGSVVFTATSAQTITLYDVAAAANFASTTLSTKIVQFATGTPAGTYTFDLNAFKGLVVQAFITPTVEGVVTFR